MKLDDDDPIEQWSAYDRMRARRRKRLNPQPTEPQVSQPEVGYRKPPAEHRFQKGHSGNPGGRPKGAQNRPSVQFERLKLRFLKIAHDEVQVNQGGRILNMSKIDYILQSAFDKAIKGNVPLMKYILENNLDIERQQKAQRDTFLEEAIQYKTFWEDTLAERKAKGIRGPDPVPHPDDIHIDMDGSVTISGPMTPEDKKEDQHTDEWRKKWQEELSAIDTERKEIEQKLGDKRFNRKQLKDRRAELRQKASTLKEKLRTTERENRYRYRYYFP